MRAGRLNDKCGFDRVVEGREVGGIGGVVVGGVLGEDLRGKRTTEQRTKLHFV